MGIAELNGYHVSLITVPIAPPRLCEVGDLAGLVPSPANMLRPALDKEAWLEPVDTPHSTSAFEAVWWLWVRSLVEGLIRRRPMGSRG